MAYQGLKNNLKKKPLRIIYLLYWFLLAYILAALIFWYLALNQQNREITFFKLNLIEAGDPQYAQKITEIENEKNRKTTQYAGEGITFFLLIVAGAVFVFKIISKQLLQSRQQQNFMMAITHELKTPIAVTKLNLETMQLRKLESSQQQKLISSTIQEANRLNALCNNMLLLNQIDTGGYQLNFEQIDLSAVAKESAAGFSSRYASRKIEEHLEDETMIMGDKVLLQLAINNLLDNAIKYSGKGDVVLIRVFHKNKKIFLRVEDEGRGVKEEEKVKIFEKYYRGAMMQTKGTGLGLYLTKEIVKQHHGTIAILDNTPKGAIFEMQFKMPKNLNH